MFEDIFNIALNFTYNQQVYEMVIILVSKQGSFEGRDEGESKVKKIIREFFFDSQENLLKQLKKKEFKPDICKMKDQRPWLYTDPWVSSDWTMLKYFATITDLGAILPERMPEGSFEDLLNLIQASYGINGSDWEKALVS